MTLVDQEPRGGWVVVGACFAALAVIFGVSYSFAAFFESYAREFSASRADVSLVFGVSGLLYFLAGAGGGLLADRHGPRIVTSAGMLCIAAALWVSSQATSLMHIVLAQGMGVGLGIALVYTPSIGCVQPWFTRRRGLAAGLASAGIGAGTLVVPVAVAMAIAAWQWRTTLQLLAGFVLVAGLAATALLKRAPAATARGTAAVPGHTLREAMRTPRFRWLYAATVLGAVPMFVPFAHASAAARDLGVADAQAVGLVGLIGIGSLTGRFAIGGVADHLGRPRTLVLGMAALGGTFVLWLLASRFAGSPSAVYAVMAVYAVVMGLSYGGIVSLLPALCMDFFGARAVSSIIGTLYTGAAFGNLAGPWLAGRLFDVQGSYTTVALVCLAFGVVAAGCAARMRSAG